MTEPVPESDREPPSPPVDEATLGVQRVQRKQAGLLVLLGVIGVAAVMPYAFLLQRDQLAEVIKNTGASLFSLALVSCAQSAALVAVAVIGGLWAARQVGLTAPVTAALARGESAWPVVRQFLPVALVVGLVAGGITAALDAMVFLPRAPQLQALTKAIVQPPLWKAALASLYGAFTEEIQVRLFCMSLLALGLGHLWRLIRGARQLGPVPWAILLTANVLAALVFGLLHLPATAALVKPLTPLLVTRALVLNGVAGLACGFLYLRRGLEAAMAAHFMADVVLHVVVPAFLHAGVQGL